MEKPQSGQIDKDNLPNKQAVEEKLHGENKMADCHVRDNIVEIGNIVITENKEKNMQADTLNEIKDADQSTNSNTGLADVENLHEVSSINLSDVYSSEKFGHDLLQFIEHGHSIENWHHGCYQDTGTEPFSPHMQMEGIPMEQCINADIQSTSESTVTLTVLNSTSTDEAAQSISFSLSQPSTHSNNLIDHDYCVYPKSGYSVMESIHESEDNIEFMQQHEVGMDQEKLLRMKRRKEKNRECSRQFRLKQKNKEQTLMKGKIEKVQELDSLKRNVEKLKSTLSKVAQQCSSKCAKTRMLLSQYAIVDKENINPEYMQIMK